MAAVSTTPLPSSLDPLSSQFAATSLKESPAGYTLPKANVDKLIDPEEVRKAIFETSYEPSEALWEADQAKYVKPSDPKDDPLPEGFPVYATGPHVWDGIKLINEPEKWLHVFTAEEIADVDSAIAHFKSLNLSFSDITQSTFPITVLKPIFDAAVQAIFTGVGLRVFRGLPVKRYSREEQIIAFAGISTYIGEHRYRQLGGSAAIAHLRDLTKLDPGTRPPITVKGYTGGNQVFHTDNGDVVGLITLNKAAEGGLSQLSSVGQLYNNFSDNRRDLLRTLAGNWQSKYDPEGAPVIDYVDGKVIAQYGRRPFFTFFEDQALPEGVPPITTSQHVALDALHLTAETTALSIDLLPGDLEYFNNLTVFHARTASEDTPEETRHLLRIWLKNEEFRTEHGKKFQKRWDGLERNEKEHPEEKWPLQAWDRV